MRQPILKLDSTIAGRFGQALVDHRTLLVIAVQFLLIVSANLTAFLLRFDGEIPAPYDRIMLLGLPLVVAVFGAGVWVGGFRSRHPPPARDGHTQVWAVRCISVPSMA